MSARNRRNRRREAREGRARRERVAAAVMAGMALAMSLALVTPAAGQAVVNRAALDPARPNLVHLRVGAEYGFVGGISYSRAIALGGRTLLLSGGLTAPWAEADLNDYDVRIGAALDLVGRSRFALVGGLGSSVRGTTNDLGRHASLAADGFLLSGYWSPGWFAVLEGGYDGAIATHVTHSDHYRSTYYADARDGWYVDAASNIRVGVASGVSSGRYDLVLRAGHARDREGHPQLLPAYATLDLNVRF